MQLYAGSQQPGRQDGEVDNPFFNHALDVALWVRGVDLDGGFCEEDEVAGEQTANTALDLSFSGLTDEGSVEFQDDADIEEPGPVDGYVFGVEKFVAEDGAVSISNLVEPDPDHRPGQYTLTVSGGPPGAQLLVRSWRATVGESVEDAEVPFSRWTPGTVLVMPRGWHAVQGGYAGVEGEPLGHSGIEVVWSNGLVYGGVGFAPEADAVNLGAVVAVDAVNRPGEFRSAVSGVPAGSIGLIRSWMLTGSEAPPGWHVPFVPWSSTMVLVMPRGRNAVQAAYLGEDGEPLGWSAVRVVWSDGWALGSAGVGGVEDPGMGVVPPVAPVLGQPASVISGETAVVVMSVGGWRSGLRVQYRVWEGTGREAEESLVPWVWGSLTGGNLVVPRAGVPAAGGGYFGVQVRFSEYSNDLGRVVFGGGSNIVHYWVLPDGGAWMSPDPDDGSLVWVPGPQSLFKEAVVDEGPFEATAPPAPSVGELRRPAGRHDFVRFALGGLRGGASVEYQVWSSNGIGPSEAESVWRVAAVSGGAAEINMRALGPEGQWLSVRFRQVAGGEAGPGSGPLEVRLPLVPAGSTMDLTGRR